MNAEEKAKELTEKYIKYNVNLFPKNARQIVYSAKNFALIAVDEIIEFSKSHPFSIKEDNDFWKEVKNEIKKL